jgi:hypothetical protein
MEKHYEVLYVDKFTDGAKAEYARENLRKLFHLNEQHLTRLASGEPVIIKKKVDLDEAVRYRQAIAAAGGTAWVQALDERGNHCERRKQSRRQLTDRRLRYRASSIQPDRRQSCGRRSTDNLSMDKAAFH